MVPTYIFERHHLLREGLKSFLAGTSFETKAELVCLKEWLENVDIQPEPILFVIGIDQPQDALLAEKVEQIREIKSHFPDTRFVVLASAEEICGMSEAFHSTIDGYLLRDLSREAILSYLTLAMMGQKVLPEPVAVLFAALRLENACGVATKAMPGAHELSDRENDIVQCLALGESNKLIAKNLDIAESTVKVHLKTILRKLGVQNRTQAALLAANQNQANERPAFG